MMLLILPKQLKSLQRLLNELLKITRRSREKMNLPNLKELESMLQTGPQMTYSSTEFSRIMLKYPQKRMEAPKERKLLVKKTVRKPLVRFFSKKLMAIQKLNKRPSIDL